MGKLKRIIGALMSIVMLISIYTYEAVGTVTATGATEQDNITEFTMDFENMSALPQGELEIKGTNTNVTATTGTATTATLDADKKALKIDIDYRVESGVTPYVVIPLSDGSNTKKSITPCDGPFSIEVRMQLSSSTDSGQLGLKGFPILSGDTKLEKSLGDNIFGLSQGRASFNYWVSAYGHYDKVNKAEDTYFLKKRYFGDNFYENKADPIIVDGIDISNIGDGVKAETSAEILDKNTLSSEFYDYKWEIDPYSETFKLYYKKARDSEWTQAFTAYNVLNPTATKEKRGDKTTDDPKDIVRYKDKGVLPTGVLPAAINSFKMQLQPPNSSWSKDTDQTYYIKHIKVSQETASFEARSAEFSSKKSITVDMGKKIDESSLSGNVTVTKDGNPVDVSSVAVHQDYPTKLVIELTDEVQEGRYSMTFNNITEQDGDGVVTGTLTATYVIKVNDKGENGSTEYSESDGLWTLRTNESNDSFRSSLKHSCNGFEVEETKNTVIEFSATICLNKFYLDGFPKLVGDDGQVYDFGLCGDAPINGYARTAQKLFKNLGLNPTYKSDGDTTATDRCELTDRVVGTGYGNVNDYMKKYTYKFVIDPIAKHYRYFVMQNGVDDDFKEPYAGVAGYPVTIEDGGLPDVISSLQFDVACDLPDAQTDYIDFGSIDIYSEDNDQTGVMSKISNRSYSTTGEVEPYKTADGSKAEISVRVVNYSDEEKPVNLYLAVYDADGMLKAVKMYDRQMLPPKSYDTYTFDKVSADEAVWDKDADNKSFVYRDGYTYRVFTADDMIRPYTAVSEIDGDKPLGTRNITCWGDSLTEGMTYGFGNNVGVDQPYKREDYAEAYKEYTDGEWRVTYPSVLQGLLSTSGDTRKVNNRGVTGEIVTEISARQGAIDITLAEPVTIPSGKERVKIEIDKPKTEHDNSSTSPRPFSILVSDANYDANGLRGTTSGVNECEIGGIKGELTVESTDNTNERTRRQTAEYYFTRSTAGEATVMPTGTQIVTRASIENAKDAVVIFAGTNGGYGIKTDSNGNITSGSPEDLITRLDKMIEYLDYENKEYVIMGLPKASLLYEDVMKERYGSRFIPLRSFMLNEAMTHVSANLTDDRLEEKKGNENGIPGALLIDATHYRPIGYEMMGELVYNKMLKLGIIENGSPVEYGKILDVE